MEDQVGRNSDDWRVSALREFEDHRRSLKALRRGVEDTKDNLPPGCFGDETGAPLDLAASVVSCCELFEDEHFGPLTRRLEDVIAWLDGRECPPYLTDQAGDS